MRMLNFLLSTAIKNLRRGGQRVFVAILCITFGVMSLVAMMLLSQSIKNMLVLEPQNLIGADISMVRTEGDYILPEHIDELDTALQQGTIDRYTLIAYTSSLSFHLPGSNQLHLPAAGLGIDPDLYPLRGKLTVGIPGNVGLPTLLRDRGDVLVTRDLAQEFALSVGDRVILSDLQVGAPLEARIRGILFDTPNHQGSKIYYNQLTAAALAGGARMLNTAHVTTANPTQARDTFQAAGWQAHLATQLALADQYVQQIFETSLNGAGILGLLVGGVGIANTMQVLLRRRRNEIAIWKTLGYRSGELQILFAVEALLLGIIGSLAGVILGVAISSGLVGLFSRTTTLLISWVFSPMSVLTGFLVGVVTAVTFAMFAVVLASRVLPMAILRKEAADAARLPWAQVFGLLAVLSLPLITVTSLVMGSILKAIGVLLVAFFGLAGIGVLQGGFIWIIPRLIPLRGIPLANMARNNLRRRGLSLVFAMIALFVGVVALASSLVITQNARRATDEQAIEIEGNNITILAPADQETAIRQVLQPTGHPFAYSYSASVQTVAVDGQEENFVSPVLIGLSEPSDYALTGAPWGSIPDGVYAYQHAEVPPGSQVEVTLWDGSTHRFQVAGTYNIEMMGTKPLPALGLLMTRDTFLKTTFPEIVRYSTMVPVGKIQLASDGLSEALPGATVINLLAYAARFSQTYQNLLSFALAMAGLAILAGVLLIANSVSLAMLDRQYELGVLKSIGYSRRHLWTTLMVEYGLVALIASFTGLLLVKGILWFIGLQNPLAGSLLVMPWQTVFLIAAGCAGLVLVTVLLSTWKPIQISPLIVLNDHE